MDEEILVLDVKVVFFCPVFLFSTEVMNTRCSMLSSRVYVPYSGSTC